MKFRHLLLCAAALAGLGANLRAQFVWTGSSLVNGSIADSNNWQVHVPPAPVGDGSESLAFGDLVGTQTTILVATSAFSSLTFNGTSRPVYVVAGTGPTPVLTLNGNLTVATGGNAIDFNNSLAISLSAGGHTVDVAPSTFLQIDGNIGGAGAATWTNAGFVTLTGANNYSGGTTIDGGATVALSGSIIHPTANLIIGQTAATASTLSLTGGAQVSDNLGRLGLSGAGTAGSVALGGAGTTWTNATYLYVGEAANGAVTVTGGAAVVSANTSIGNNTGGYGTVSVDGAGSSLTNSANLYVGSQGNGNLSVTGGAQATNVNGSIGNNVGGIGFATIDGAGSAWTNSGDLHVGASALGTLSVSGGAVVSSANLYLGTVATGTGSITADGPGTALNVSNVAYVGYQGTGDFFLGNGAVLSVANGNGVVYLGYGAGAQGNLILNDEGSPAGIVNASTITTLGGTGFLTFQTDTTSVNPTYLTKDGTATGVPVDIAGATSVLIGGGYNVLSGANTYTGGTSIVGGTVVAASNTALGTGLVTFASPSDTLVVANGVTINNALNLINGGRLAGNGTFGSAITIGNAVTLAPGNSPGTLSFANGLTLAGGGALELQVQQAGGIAGTDYDLVNVLGGTLDITATSGSQFKISLQSLDGTGAPGSVGDFVATSPYTWTIFTAAGGITNFSAADFLIDASGFTNSLGAGGFYVVQSGNQIQLDFAPVPEPSTYALFAAGLGLVGFVLRRRRARSL